MAGSTGGVLGLFKRGSARDDHNTVAFGDASAVRSMPIYSLLALFGLMLFWFLATQPFGFPNDFKASVDKTFQVAADDAEVRNQERIDSGNANLIEIPFDDQCSSSDYSQFLGPSKFPSPGDTWVAFNRLRTRGFQNETLAGHAGISLWRVIRGMFWGTLIGVPIGFAMGLSSRLRGLFDTPVELFRPIPPLALLPLFIVWFGIGDGTAVRLLIFASVWIMIIAARAGAQTVKLSKVRAAYSLGASKSQVLRRVILPNALPELFTGVRVALGVSWGTLVAAELVGASSGLGSMIFTARNNLRLDVVVVGVIVIAVIGVMMDLVMRFAESRLIPWRGKG
jgi:taurine transport system permease protein